MLAPARTDSRAATHPGALHQARSVVHALGSQLRCGTGGGGWARAASHALPRGLNGGPSGVQCVRHGVIVQQRAIFAQRLPQRARAVSNSSARVVGGGGEGCRGATCLRHRLQAVQPRRRQAYIRDGMLPLLQLQLPRLA